MATNLTTTYAGKRALPYLSAAILETNSLTNGMFTIRQNVLYREVVKTLAIGSDLVQDDSCDFTALGDITIAERHLDPKPLKINITDCKLNYVSDWEVENMGKSSWKNYPTEVANSIIPEILAMGMAQLEVNLYSGVTANSGEFDGVETLLTLDASLPAAQEITGIAITALNVIDELAKVIDATPDRVKNQPDFHIGVATNVFNALVRSLGTSANGIDNKLSTWYKRGEAINFEGYPIIQANGMTTNLMIATTTANMWFGTALLSDGNRVELLDDPYDGSDNVKFVAKYSAGVQYGFAGDVVTYGIVNAAN